MSTIRHPAQMHLWWYAASAVFAGAVLALMILTLRPSGPAPSTEPDSTITTYHHYRVFPCHAGHPVPNIELSPCVGRLR